MENKDLGKSEKLQRKLHEPHSRLSPMDRILGKGGGRGRRCGPTKKGVGEEGGEKKKVSCVSPRWGGAHKDSLGSWGGEKRK